MDSIKLSPEIEQYIQESDKNRNYSQFTPDKRLKGDKEREFFISKFPRSEIRNIKMLDYVPGKTVNGDADRETFAYLTEFGSRNLGTIGGGSAKKFAIYMGKESQKPVYPPTFASADAAYHSTINLIADCVLNYAEDFIKTKDWKKFSDIITQSVESQVGTPSIPVISKIIAIYYPDEFLRIWSHQWLNKILDLFQVNRDDLPETGKEGRFYEKMQRVIEAKNSHPIMKEWSNKYFSYTIGDYIVEKNSEKIESPLLKFLKSEMKMQANYQPIVIKMLLEAEDSNFTVSIKQIREKFDELNFGRMSYVKASGRPGGNDAISSVAGALRKFVKFPEGTSQGNATLKEDVIRKEEIPECLKICGQRIAGWHIDNIIDDDDFEVYGVLPGTKEDDFVYLDDFIKSDHIGSGWNQLGDLSKYSTKDAALEYIRNDHPEYVKKQSATQIRFDIKPKDIVVLSKGQKEIIDFGIVTGDYHYRTDELGEKFAAHTRSVVWLKRGNIKKENFPNERMMDGVVATVNLIDKYEKEMINLLLEEEKAETGNYYVITQNPDSKYEDIEGKQYGYDSDKNNYKNFQQGTKFVVQSKIEGKIFFIGYGKVGRVEKTQETKGNGKPLTKIIAKFSNYTNFEENKIRTEAIKQKLLKVEFPNSAGTGKKLRPAAMLKIPRKLYEEITGDRSTMSSNQETISEEKLNPYVQALEWKPNLILYGPPGTGKTYHATEVAKLITRDQHTAGTNITLKPQTWLAVATKVLLENNGTVTNYQDITKLAATFYANDTVGRTPHETIAKDIRNDIENNGDDSFFVHPSDGMYGLKTPTSFVKAAEIILLAEHKPLHTDKITEIARSKSMIRQNEQPGITPTRSMNQVITQDIARNGDNSTFVKISPATYILRKQIQKVSTTQIKNQYYKTVTFHQTFSYEEFMEGIKAKPTEDGTGVVYDVEDGIFKKFCETAADDDKNKYIMIIDEINRGNIAKIFGELITIIEKDKREGKKITLAYSKKEFSVPKNVLIIGTMNTADQSLTHLDAALKRRFTMMEIYPDPSVLRNHKVEGKINLTELLVVINRKLVDNEFRDGQIGHAYFMSGKDPLSKISELQMVFAYDIIPLLREYFYDDESKMKGIFGEGNWQSWFDEKSGDINKKWQGSDGEENFVDNIKKSFGV